MRERTVRTTYQEQLRPTPEHERALDAVVWRCRALYHTALAQRITAWQRSRVSVSRSEQEAEVKDIRTEFPDDAAIHSHILQAVLARLAKTYQAVFRRLQRGENEARRQAFPASRAALASTPSPSRRMAMARGWSMATWSGPRLGVAGCLGADPSRERPRRSPSGGRPTAGMWRSRALMFQYSHSPYGAGDRDRDR